MPITGASEKVPGLFYDNGAARIHASHPEYGVQPNGSDVGPGINGALDAAKLVSGAAGGTCLVQLPPGPLTVSTPIDLSNLEDQSPTGLVGTGMAEQGNPASGTTLIGNTGSAVIDVMGSENVVLRDFLIYAAAAQSNMSTIGILMGRTAGYGFCQLHHYRRVMIYLESKPTASARGTVGIYNVNAEHFLAEHVRVVADCPWVFATSDVLALPGPYGGAHSGAASMTLVDLNQCTASAWTKAAYELWGAQNIAFRHVYASRILGNTTAAPFNINAACDALDISGQFEEWAAYMNLNANLSASRLGGFIVSPTSGLLSSGGAVDLSECDIELKQVNGTIQSLLGSFVAGSRILNSRIRLQAGQVANSANVKLVGCDVGAHDTACTVNVDPASTMRLLGPMDGVSSDRGDANVTLAIASDKRVQRFATTLTANRTVTLPTTGVYNGARYRIVRTGLGAFTLNVGGLKTIPSATAATVDVVHDGTAWRLAGYQPL